MSLGEGIPAIVQGQPLFAFGAAFLGGLLSAANPCVLATVPLVIGLYALGHCVLILAAGVSVGFVNGFINSKGLVRASGYIKRASGALLVGVGGYVAYSNIF